MPNDTVRHVPTQDCAYGGEPTFPLETPPAPAAVPLRPSLGNDMSLSLENAPAGMPVRELAGLRC